MLQVANLKRTEVNSSCFHSPCVWTFLCVCVCVCVRVRVTVVVPPVPARWQKQTIPGETILNLDPAFIGHLLGSPCTFCRGHFIVYALDTQLRSSGRPTYSMRATRAHKPRQTISVRHAFAPTQDKRNKW
eukprot:2341309-Amphidinium_carterae.1